MTGRSEMQRGLSSQDMWRGQPNPFSHRSLTYSSGARHSGFTIPADVASPCRTVIFDPELMKLDNIPFIKLTHPCWKHLRPGRTLLNFLIQSVNLTHSMAPSNLWKSRVAISEMLRPTHMYGASNELWTAAHRACRDPLSRVFTSYASVALFATDLLPD